MLASTKDLIDQEVNVDIQHVEVAIQLGQEIEDLKLEDSWIDDQITLIKARLENFKNTLV